jgi:hypothetical protein
MNAGRGKPASRSIGVNRAIAAEDGNTQAAVDTAVEFVQTMFEPLKQYLPG